MQTAPAHIAALATDRTPPSPTAGGAMFALGVFYARVPDYLIALAAGVQVETVERWKWTAQRPERDSQAGLVFDSFRSIGEWVARSRTPARRVAFSVGLGLDTVGKIQRATGLRITEVRAALTSLCSAGVVVSRNGRYGYGVTR